MYQIKINNVSVYYETVCALKNIVLNIKKNEFIGIIGPNGGGKTTLLKVLLGLIKPTAGSVKKEKNLKIGYVPQFVSFDMSFPINVYDVVLMGKLPTKFRLFLKYSKTDKINADNIMKKLGIIELKKRQISQLSGGQLQKVLIARALMLDPNILVLDEPTASLDNEIKKEIYELLKRLSNDKTIIIVSHETEELYNYIDSYAYINKTLQSYEQISTS